MNTYFAFGISFLISISGLLFAQTCGNVNSANGLVINLADPSGCNCSAPYAFYDDGGPTGNYSNNRRDTVLFVNPGGVSASGLIVFLYRVP